jgi:LmbE family N-acetylglucosaminyl deacetylase
MSLALARCHRRGRALHIIDNTGRIVAVSPHLDDAALGCGALLAAYPGALVVTVFSALPAQDAPVTEWDARCGFRDGVAAMTQRRLEDDKALHLLKAEPLRLEFLDAQYVAAQQRAATRPERLAAALAPLLEAHDAGTVLVPMGLFHGDHILASDALLSLMPGMPGRNWVAYEEALYRNKPGLLQGRLVQLYTRGIRATPVAFATNSNVHRKATAVAAYASQLQELGVKKSAGEAAAPERFWLLQEAIKQEA